MDTMSAMMWGEFSRGEPLMVFDWDKAARLIRASGAQEARAGLQNDWEYTGGTILRDGEPVLDPGTYLASTWATPELEINGVVEDCYRMESEAPGWNSGTVWPESALNILKGG